MANKNFIVSLVEDTAKCFVVSTAAWLALFSATEVWDRGMKDSVAKVTKKVFKKKG